MLLFCHHKIKLQAQNEEEQQFKKQKIKKIGRELLHVPRF